MATDPRKLRPSELCRLLNSTPLGEVLSERQLRILELSADGWAVPEIATELKTSPERISDEKYKAIRKLRVHLGTDAA